MSTTTDSDPLPSSFAAFADGLPPGPSPLREQIIAAWRRAEPEALPPLLEQARLPRAQAEEAHALAHRIARQLRSRKNASGRAGLVQGLLQEYALSSQEGVALMCLAEALLRIPDRATRDALIRDKISKGDWKSHVGHAPSLFVNAATWGLMITGKLVTTNSEAGLSSALTRLIGKGGEPLIRKGVDMAMRLMGEQFVTGETISEALANSRKYEARGFRYSYDMLGEAATTEEDAQRYYASYEQAIHAIGKAAGGRGIYEGPGISIKLSALHPRYSRAQQERTMNELRPRVRSLAQLARRYDIGLNIDAEEADRLEISLDLFERLASEPTLEGWSGLGFVVQAYQKRARSVIDWLVALARSRNRRLMVRLVKGAYWDTEIKRAQVDGLSDYPVFTRKVHTDVSYLACAKAMLAAPDALYPQFASHNAFTIAAVHTMAGDAQFEFQCLHGMGESVYDQVVGNEQLARPCRIYAPVGSHETLLAYLVRRLLENGANSSFVNRIVDPSVDIAELVADPVVRARETRGTPHPRIPKPAALYPDRRNSAGCDFSDEATVRELEAFMASPFTVERAAPTAALARPRHERRIVNPADRRELVGIVEEADAGDVERAVDVAARSQWLDTDVEHRARCLTRAADLIEEHALPLMRLAVLEAGKSLVNAQGEVREAADFCRYYAAQARRELRGTTPRGPIASIAPWNFPLAIFVGQVSAALAAGNAVAAKPAEQTPLTAAFATRCLIEGGIPAEVLALLPGDGEHVGAALVAHPHIAGVAFTGSTDVASRIAQTLAARQPIVPLIAETGGLNAMLVDSSALPEQVVQDAIVSAFDSAGQRCSALRVLCLQEDIAPRVLELLRGAMDELVIGDPALASTDVGPVIDEGARDALEAHVSSMQRAGLVLHRVALPEATANGTFVAPTLIELDRLDRLTCEVFGPVLHVHRFRAGTLDALVDGINAFGYGLTLGIHSRIDNTVARVVERARVGNIYVNRNMIGAVVGMQPFGGEGLSGTGPKAGGPHYLFRFAVERTVSINTAAAGGNAALLAQGES